ncbi:nitroreductase family protein [Nocardiopsis suaedae]|uniref:Cyanobactin oxidase ThcOx second domain-containing protein n=1 Tax=Nocardiopsis suaedae TaxID=3018444 RepID=A0ABT4TQK5_9ACTN|nr:hypothetical protein [Nocardiopsis suaedae]MDA2806968.1 hypothetical protein [Nocardiopsis suaedae]
MFQHGGGTRPQRLLSLIDGALVEEGADGSLTVASRWGDVRVADPGPAVRTLLDRMSLGPVSPDNVLPCGGPERDRALDGVRRVLEDLDGCVVHSLSDGNLGGPVLSVEPVAPWARFTPPLRPRLPAGLVVRMSRYAVVRTSGTLLLAESPLALHRVVLHRSEALRVIGALASPVGPEELAAELDDIAPAVLWEVVAHLTAAGVAVQGRRGPEGGRPLLLEDTDTRLAPWSPHDLLFHSRRRPGRDGRSLAASARTGPGNRPPPRRVPLPGAKPPVRAVVVPPDPGRPLRAAELGALLSRALDQGAPGVMDAVPAVPGPERSLDFYITVNHSSDVERGIYRYSPRGHALLLVNSDEEDTRALLDCARVAGGSGPVPAVLITIAARMPAIPRSVEASPYATALLLTGALQERLRQAAQDLRLAASVLVTGDGETSARALRLDGIAEVPTGDFSAG